MSEPVHERAIISLADVKVALTTLLQLRHSLLDLQSRCFSIADIENINRTIYALQERLEAAEIERATLIKDLQNAAVRERAYKQELDEMDYKLSSLQRCISLVLSEHVIDADLFNQQASGRGGREEYAGPQKERTSNA